MPSVPSQIVFLSSEVPRIRQALSARKPRRADPGEGGWRAAVAMILRAGEGARLETLLMRRAEHPQDRWSGEMSFPGGRQEEGDASLEEAARRETAEEVGLALAPRALIGLLDDALSAPGRGGRVAISPFVYYLAEPGPVRLGQEAVESVWIPLDFLADAANVRLHAPARGAAGRLFPSFPFGPRVIWGLTYRIIHGFMGRFGRPLPDPR